MIALVSFMGFLIGDFQGTGTGTVSIQGKIELSQGTTLMEHALKILYDQVASEWETGLSPSEIRQVQSEQMDLPGIVLLATAKMDNKFSQQAAKQYYAYLKPKLTWQTFTNEAVSYTSREVKVHHKTITRHIRNVSISHVPLVKSASTWDGRITNTYRYVDLGSKSWPIVGTHRWRHFVQRTSTTRVYNWDRLWTMFQSIPSSNGRHDIIQKNLSNQQMFAGLVATNDFSLADPIVQQMVQNLLFPVDQKFHIPSIAVRPATMNLITNVLRYKPVIDAVSSQYHVPAVLVASVMAQESGGHQQNQSGGILTSSTGALGLLQVQPSTASAMVMNGSVIGPSAVTDLSSPAINIEVGAKYLSELYQEFGRQTIEALAAYNAGPGGEDEALATGHEIAQNSQTIAYVKNIVDRWIPVFTPFFDTSVKLTRNP